MSNENINAMWNQFPFVMQRGTRWQVESPALKLWLPANIFSKPTA